MGRPPLTIAVLAVELVEGDFIAGEGKITMLEVYPRRGKVPYICAFFDLKSELFLPDDKIVVHLEDDGRE